ncbi:MAG: TonB-dependent receptor [Bacteroidales bacterium]|nr:TonB-dependent receptor [Bacteroidales bacterium]
MKKGVLVFVGMLALTSAYAEETKSPLSEIAAPWDNINVKGVVYDETGSPIPGVSVYVKGTTSGTITDFDGNFSINVDPDATLVFSFIGYSTEEIAIAGRTNIGKVVLREDNKEIEQVVVIGYGTQKKVDLTGSVAIVDADEMKKVSNSNISTMLEGKVAGVQITTDGQPGADPSVRIRGIGSFGSTAPLYVVDGVPMSSIRDFSPNDIASIQILKDASAAAIYGSRAANGVIIITTKSGKKNQPLKVEYSGYLGIDKVNNNKYDVMDANQYVEYMTQAAKNSGSTLPEGYVPGSAHTLLDANGNSTVNTDWFDAIFKTGIRQNHNVNLSGGSENGTYNIGLDYFKQNGAIEGAGPNFQRYTARVNNTMDVKFLKIKTSFVYSHSDQDALAVSNANEFVDGLYGNQGNVLEQALYIQPTIKAYDPSTWCLDDRISAAKAYEYDAYGFGVADPVVHGDYGRSNPLLLLNNLERNTKVDRIVASASTDVDLFKMVGFQNDNHSLHYNLNLSYSKTYAKDRTWIGAWIQTNKIYEDKSYERLSQGFRNYDDALIENTITYDGKFGSNHLNVVVGQTYENEYFNRVSAWGITYQSPYYLQINNGKDRDAESAETQHVLASYIGRINYDYDGKYLLSATVRRDGSSRLSSDDRWGVFPSVSLGWRLDKESFFNVDSRLINLLKLRGSYGILGNENIGEYQYMDVMDTNNFSYSFGGNVVYGSAITKFVNTAIAWEKKKSTSFGIDLGMLDGAFDFTFEYYKNNSEDLLYEVPVPNISGTHNPPNNTVTMNAASMENSGFEFSANYHNYKRALKYDLSFNMSTLKNKVTSLGAGNGLQRIDGANITIVGQEVGQFYGWIYEGIFRTQDQLDGHATQNGANVGDCAYKDISGPDGQPDGIIDAYDQTVLGSGLPKISFGISGRVEYKGWDLSVATFGALKYKVADALYNGLSSCYGGNNHLTKVLDANKFDANGTYISDVPRTYLESTSELGWNDLFSERKIQKANYWKISNVEIGYNFPNAWFHDVVSNVRMYVSGQNLATLSKYKGYNIDYAGGVFTPGVNYCSFPTPRTFMVGLRASF